LQNDIRVHGFRLEGAIVFVSHPHSRIITQVIHWLLGTGQTFSFIEQRVVLSMLLRKFDFAIPKDSPHANQLCITGSGVSRPDALFLSVTERV
jgi:hypothetical protein